MVRSLASQTPNLIGQTVLLKGWVHVRRDHGKIIFIDLRDRTGLVQVVLSPELAGHLHGEDVIAITGLVAARPAKLVNPKLASGTVEIQAERVEELSKAADLPFDMGQGDLNLELPTLLDYRSLTLRHPKIQAIFKVQSVIIDAFRQALLAKDFLEFQSPSIISSVPEGGAEVFKVKYFQHEAYLSQSPQLYKSLLVGAFERVFSVDQIFRAEPSVTTRHLTEATSLDAEFGFLESWEDVQDMEEYVIRYIFAEVAKRCPGELALFNATLPQLSAKIPVIKLRDAQQIIFDRTGRDCRTEKDLAPEDEREICNYAKEKLGSDLIFISHFLTAKKPFYVYPDPADPTYAFSVDLLGRGVEWSSGGQRLNNYAQILDHVQKWGLKPEDIELYLQSFRYGVPPLGGFALGAERMTMHILGLKNIREASIFPRDMERIDTSLSDNKSPNNLIPGEEVYKKIIAKLETSGVQFTSLEHVAAHTSEESAKIRGTKLEQGAKALVMYADEKPLLLVLSAAKKANLSKIKDQLHAAAVRLSSPKEAIVLTGLEIGAIPPFGSVLKLPTYLDKSLESSEKIAFNAGLHTKSIFMKYADFEQAEKPLLGDYSE